MTKETLEKGKQLVKVIDTLKESIIKLDTMTPGCNDTRMTIAIVKDPRVINVIRKALTICIDEKQEEFNKL